MCSRSRSPAVSGPRLSRIALETPSLPKQCTRPARRSVATSSSGRPSRRPAAATSSATARACPREYGDLRSTKSAIASRASSNWSSVSTTVSAGSASITASQRRTCRARTAAASASAANTSDEVRVELLAALVADEASAVPTPPTRCATSTNSPITASRAAIGTLVTAELARPSAAVPLLVRRGQGVEGLRRQPEVLAEPARHLRVMGDHGVRSRWPHTANSRPRRNLSISPSAPDPNRRIVGDGASARRSCRSCTCRPSARCRRRTTSPARARPSDSRR